MRALKKPENVGMGKKARQIAEQRKLKKEQMEKVTSAQEAYAPGAEP